MSSLSQRTFTVVFILILCLFQYGCSASHFPSNSVVIDALDLQMNLTGSSLDELLQTKQEVAELSGVNVDSSNFLENSEGRILAVSGQIKYK